MIEVQHLTKRYGQHVALDAVSFSVRHGEVVGFLGPNGAGKSTTMRILTTFMAATSGMARIGGDCVFENPMRVRKRLGYMPENNPLPPDLRVGDYLKFRAQLKRLANGESARRIAEVMEQCGVADVAGRFIGQLSRGYRQRVGMADALLAKPELIVLDEPTAGLDPNQVRSVRKLIRELAGSHTMLISSHILSEIEMTCDRIVILHKGRLLASGALDELMAKATPAVVAEVRAPLDDAKEWAAQLALGQAECAAQQDGYVRCRFVNASNTGARKKIFASANERGWPLRELTRQAPSLEDLFVNLTHGKEGGE
ncbi:MAG: ABC transporter ATP-binding protein [Verrucomicrobiota bacterium]|jgi:ABC-2 type transport system ATP-binding protein|nr:ABC transporter ATP-binding protein [Verrucomicrobiota bacterium]MDP7177707.1 ABC transporter ATP-binding protein [Verrucomicrobiota bacterium]HJN81554.1 ABC transporter ATP-binding protein [Verrucomicrobiota bacterium]|tara:strand:- start:461 stop:1396 length:936 start_codon:yes stop_codon:yes gene_type:complete